ncbi:MAG: sulfatase [Verrucomicrobiae bacterium]|nr:sulfatase [Verrucomicrobiae bacterium]
MKSLTLLTALLLAPLAALLAADAPKQKPNIIVILADDLGWADLSCYGSKFHESPNLDRLAAEGMRFTQAYSSSPYCSPSRAAIMTGRCPARLKITDYIPSNGKSGKLLPAEMKMELPLEEVTLAEVLRDAGYATWHVGKWHLGERGFFPEDQGFEVNIAGNHSGAPTSFFWPYGHDQSEAAKRYHGSPVPGLVEGGKEGEHLCDRLTSEAMKLIGRRKTGQPFFLYLAFYDVHTPIMAKPELVKKYEAKAARLGLPPVPKTPRFTEDNRAHGGGTPQMPEQQVNPIYAAMIETMDTNVGRLMARLAELGIGDDTLILFTSDNGGHSVTSNRPLRGGKGWLYEGGVREPWIVKWPGVTKPGSTCDVPVMNTDILPTVLEVCGLPAKPDLHKDGVSFVSLLRGETKPVHDALFWHFPHYGNHGSGPNSSVRVGDWKLVHWIEDDSVELFNLGTDLGEKTDLAAQQPERVKDLRARLDAWRKETGANMPRPKPAGQAVVPATADAQADFAVVANARVEKLDTGYRLRAEPKQAGFALKRLEQPLTGAMTFKVRCASAPGHAFPKHHENGFLVLGDGPAERDQIHVGAFFGGQKNLAIIEGPLQVAGRTAQPFTAAAQPLELTIRVDLANGQIVLEAAGQRLGTKLKRRLQQITHVGYSSLNAVTDFSKWEQP